MGEITLKYINTNDNLAIGTTTDNRVNYTLD